MSKQERPSDSVADTYEDCYVAFLDILGFRDRVGKSNADPRKLQDIIGPLTEVNKIPTGGGKRIINRREDRNLSLRFRSFSDSLIFFIKQVEQDIAHLFFAIRYVQDLYWKKGLCLRGAITQGRMHWATADDNLTVGPGLIEAHRLESTIAIFPRVVVSNGLVKHIDKKMIEPGPFGRNNNQRLVEFIRQDVDGVYFLDLLNPRISRTEGEAFARLNDGEQFTIWHYPHNYSRINEVRRAVKKIVDASENSQDEKVKQKQAWLCTYLNSCNPNTPA